jgi:hypothetical protein
MIQENPDRNFLVYELWKKGRTIDDISFETAIPRSTVGYYVRKFNKCARSGEPIVFQRIKEKPDEKAMAVQAWVKGGFLADLVNTLKEKDGLDKAYKTLMIVKLMKELQHYIFVTDEERQAFTENWDYILDQILSAKKHE